MEDLNEILRQRRVGYRGTQGKQEKEVCVDGIKSSQAGQVDRLDSLMWPTLQVGTQSCEGKSQDHTYRRVCVYACTCVCVSECLINDKLGASTGCESC